MKREILEPQEALQQGTKMPWAFVRSLSRVSLGQTPENVDAAELLEASFFSPQAEIRLWRENGRLQAAILTEEDDHGLEEWFDVENRAMGKEIAVRKYIDFDEDGQACVTASRLCGWKGGGGDA